MTRDEIEVIVRTFITDTYGDNGMSRALVVALGERIDKFDDEGGRYHREDMIRNVCWDWMTGGTTAQYVAEKIESALKDASAASTSRGDCDA